ncbi:MAG TPA: RNA 2',3'-cyclic phosphodiesterase [Dehalococcoidia bacterium]|jgi:2'-5' RNA ligase|nr:RNA 2',3'-cyclic phosphodiesterase [Dehalococcoidia bacterium]
MEQIRSFIAIELPEELKLGLAQLQDRLKSGKQSGVKWVDPYGIHLTLKFLGNIEVDRTGAITSAIEATVQGISPFHLEIKDLGAFPNLRRVQVIWVGVSGEVDKLGQLQQRIESNLTPLGFTAEARSFTPHLTLARLQNQASLDERQGWGQLIANTKFEAVYSIEVEAINLMRSQLTRKGTIYSRISSIKLNRPLPTAAT